uniref:Uncharacterized protein n=3 Tax=Avena sativa TaxID=4498 RepID=A0ACD5ZE05_AVESA
MRLGLGPRRRSPRLLALRDGPDLISTLPDDLLLLVLARLGCAAAAARTGVLSRRWRGLWPRLRRIVFSDVALLSLEAALGRFPPPPPAVSLVQIRVPKPRGGVPKPRGRVPKKHRADIAINSLLRAAARLDPEEISLILPSRFVVHSFLLELPCFNRATSLVLDLCSTVSCVPPAVDFPALEALSLSSCTADLEAVLSRCPRLRTLSIANVSIHDGFLSIESPSLQELVVARGTWIKHVSIVAPVLTQMTMSLNFYQKGDISVLVPMVEKISWDCYLSGMDIDFGIWRLMKLSLHKAETQGQLPLLHIHACIRPTNVYGGGGNFDEAENFTQEIEKHMMAEFAIFELHINPRGHVFGALAFRLLGMNQVSSAMQRLKVILTRSMMKKECPLNCPCEPSNWRSQTISLNALEEVEINGFDGDDHEIDFLKLIFKCAPMLQKMTVKLSHEVSSRNDDCTEIYNTFREYYSVECYVYLSSGLMHGSQNLSST